MIKIIASIVTLFGIALFSTKYSMLGVVIFLVGIATLLGEKRIRR